MGMLCKSLCLHQQVSTRTVNVDQGQLSSGHVQAMAQVGLTSSYKPERGKNLWLPIAIGHWVSKNKEMLP